MQIQKYMYGIICVKKCMINFFIRIGSFRFRKQKSRCSDDSRPTSKEMARVVVVPRVPAQ